MGMAMPAPMPPADVGESITADNGSKDISRSFSMSSSDYTNSNICSLHPEARRPRCSAASAPGGKKARCSSTATAWLPASAKLNPNLACRARHDYLQLQQDFIACTVCAKRGCATHPRSIAERERRTRISKRLRRLQDLVPNMDKRKNTSDMLDIAVDYIKVLQDQIDVCSTWTQRLYSTRFHALGTSEIKEAEAFRYKKLLFHISLAYHNSYMINVVYNILLQD